MTKKYCLVGYPIEKSPSPSMHNAGFMHHSVDATYILRPTQPQYISTLLDEIKKGIWNGLNITIPLKTSLLTHFKHDSKTALAGAANTLFQNESQWTLTNTDIDGILNPIKNRCSDLDHCLIIGSGGAARAAVVASLQLGAKVHVLCRNTREGAALVGIAPSHQQGSVLCFEDASSLQKIFPSLNCIIQATPIGKNDEKHTLPWEHTTPHTLAFDLVYKASHTPFLDDAQNHGADTIEGWEMLLEQGLKSFELWTGLPAPKHAMQQALLAHLHA